jgi:sulfatase maturation enzyme AslB (radical SAM superfamily)
MINENLEVMEKQNIFFNIIFRLRWQNKLNEKTEFTLLKEAGKSLSFLGSGFSACVRT